MSFALRPRSAPEPLQVYLWGQTPDGKTVTSVEPALLVGDTWEERHAALTDFLARQDLAGQACVQLRVEPSPPHDAPEAADRPVASAERGERTRRATRRAAGSVA